MNLFIIICGALIFIVVVIAKFKIHPFITLILAAIITPPDVFSQVLVAFPVLILYEFSIRIAARVQRKEATSETVVK